jgi:transposase-like protein
MITTPLNDRGCLDPVTDIVRSLVENPDDELAALARELGIPVATIRWMRSLPQRDDTGEPGDGPRVDACSPPQRLRLPAPDPNCLERASLYCILAEMQDPKPVRRLATIDTPVGRHTLPVENNRPVVLDPRVPRNCAQSGIDILAETPAPADLTGCAAWVCRVAAEPAHKLPGGLRRLRNGQAALVDMTQGRPVAPSLADDVATVLALASREAPQWGPAGVGVVERVAQAVLDLERAVGRCACAVSHRGACSPSRLDHDAPHAHRNAVELQVGRYRLRPAIPKGLTAALRALGVVGLQAGTAMARVKLATLGVTPGVLGILESELNKDGMTLGGLTKPAPPPHSIAALTKDALVARHLERTGAA